jgi:cephalosporin hydroxylase
MGFNKYMNLPDLEKVEISQIKNGHWSFFGSFMQQTPIAVLALNKLINAHNFDTIIEFGTHDAGLSLLFSMYCFGSRVPAVSDNLNEPILYKNNTISKIPKKFYTFDITIRDKNWSAFCQKLGAEVIIGDILTDDKLINDIGSLITNGGKVLILGDNGDKVKEFEIYSKYLKSGDFFMLHDWSYDESTFEQNKKNNIWFSMETNFKLIEDTMKKNNIIQVYNNVFDKAVWFCGLKQ